MYTANYALQYLVTQGKANLDSRLVDLLGSAFVEDTIDITYNGYENPGLKVNKQWKAELTLRDILRHQAGFPADPQYHNDSFDQCAQRPFPVPPTCSSPVGTAALQPRRDPQVHLQDPADV